jgi:hypothetical protein
VTSLHRLSLPILLCLLALSSAHLAAQTATPPAASTQSTSTDPRLAALEAENARLRAQLQQALDQIATLQKQLTKTSEDKQDLEAERKRLEQLAGLTAKGETIQSAIARINTSFDSAANRTTVASIDIKPLENSSIVNSPHRLAFAFSYPGSKLTGSPDDIHFSLTAFFRPNTRYGSQNTITLLLDNQPLQLAVGSYDRFETVKTRGPKGTTERYHEKLIIPLTIDQLRTIAGANSLTLQIAGNDLILPRDFAATAGAMRERIQLAK